VLGLKNVLHAHYEGGSYNRGQRTGNRALRAKARRQKRENSERWEVGGGRSMALVKKMRKRICENYLCSKAKA